MRIYKLDLLFWLYVFCIIIAEMMGAKTFNIIQIGEYQLRSSVAIFLIPVIYSINDIIVEVYGKERMKSIIRTTLLLVWLIIPITLLFTLLPSSSRFMEHEVAYNTVFGLSIRISLASLIAFAVADFLDVYVFSMIKEKLEKYGLWLRNNLSNFIAQAVDTFIFMTLAFYALNSSFGDNMIFIISIGFPYWLLKCAMSIIETPFVYIWVRWLKHNISKTLITPKL